MVASNAKMEKKLTRILPDKPGRQVQNQRNEQPDMEELEKNSRRQNARKKRRIKADSGLKRKNHVTDVRQKRAWCVPT